MIWSNVKSAIVTLMTATNKCILKKIQINPFSMLCTFVTHLVVYSIRRGLEVSQEMRCSQGLQEFLFQKQMTVKPRSEKQPTLFIVRKRVELYNDS